MPDVSDQEILNWLVSKRPLIDVRAPIEFTQGCVPGAINLPLLDDSERAQIGTVYKQKGNEAAVALGHQLISGETREMRIAAWKDFAVRNPSAALYCFRGGLRSQSVQRALREHGIEIPLINGGYKRVRQILMALTESISQSNSFHVISGYTGTRKTLLLGSLRGTRSVCDLEELACHKGSAFGSHSRNPQPSQADFENRLALELYRGAGEAPILVEDESRMIGYNVLPLQFYLKMQTSPVYLVEATIEDRAQYLTEQYLRENIGANTETDPEALREPVLAKLQLIRRRLGGLEYSNLVRMFEAALVDHRRVGEIDAHFGWVGRLLKIYYDPLYQYHLAKIGDRVVARGSFSEIQACLSKTIND